MIMNPKFSIDLPEVKLLNGHLLTLCMYMSLLHVSYTLHSRDRPRFFDQVGHQTINASIGNKDFFTK